MKRSLLAAIIAVLLMPALPAHVVDSGIAASSAEDDVDDLRRLIAAWDDALKDRNAQALSRMLADNYTMTDASGAVLTKAEYLQSVVKTPALRLIKSFASDDISITVEENERDYDGKIETATVTGRSEIKGRARGGAQMVPGIYRFTDRWFKANGKWRAASTTASREPFLEPIERAQEALAKERDRLAVREIGQTVGLSEEQQNDYDHRGNRRRRVAARFVPARDPHGTSVDAGATTN